MVLRYTPTAREDIAQVKHYITHTLKNPIAAKNVARRMVKDCSILKEQPLCGGDLAAKTGRDTDLHYLVCGEHIAFYRVEEGCVSIIRILDGRSNYLSVLFGEEEY